MRRGFTLIELAMTMAIIIVLLGPLWSQFADVGRNWRVARRQADVRHEARLTAWRVFRLTSLPGSLTLILAQALLAERGLLMLAYLASFS